MSLMPPTDFMFLGIESREHPMHVGGLELFRPPEGAGPDFVRGLYEEMINAKEIGPLFRRRPGTLNTLRNLLWITEEDVDLEYHVQLTALPNPRRIRELLSATSRWHGALLDRHRPLWEIRLVEGIEDGRFAVYTKVHHALLDGVGALRTLQNVLSEDPDDRECPPPFAPRRRRREESNGSSKLNPLALARAGGRLVGDVAGTVPAAMRIGLQAYKEHDMALPLQAPRTMFNVPIGGARRFAAQSWPIDRIRLVGKALGCTLNDMVLAMCSGALREYLLMQNALPDQPLIAMVPVSLRSMTEADDGGNAVTAVLANLGTHHADPIARLQCITSSMAQAKKMMTGLRPLQALAVGAVTVSPLALSLLPGITDYTRPPFNVVISNVPGPRKPMYWNGAKLEGIYPLSIAMDGQAMNITLTSNADSLDFGVIGCRRSVPHLQYILQYLENALTELELAVT